jgi:succinate dehydrogenase (ubiquinone) iron-sulfur subunit
VKTFYIKDKNRRFSFLYIEKKKIVLQYIFNNLNLPVTIREKAYIQYIKLVQFNSITKIKNRCLLTNRARSIYRRFKMSRIFFKEYALRGDLMGVKKASW